MGIVCSIIYFLLRCVRPLLAALNLSFYHGLPKTPQLCLLVSLLPTRRFMCLDPGSSVTVSLCTSIVETCLSQSEWCNAPSSCISMSLRVVPVLLNQNNKPVPSLRTQACMSLWLRCMRHLFLYIHSMPNHARLPLSYWGTPTSSPF